LRESTRESLRDREIEQERYRADKRDEKEILHKTSEITVNTAMMTSLHMGTCLIEGMVCKDGKERAVLGAILLYMYMHAYSALM